MSAEQWIAAQAKEASFEGHEEIGSQLKTLEELYSKK